VGCCDSKSGREVGLSGAGVSDQNHALGLVDVVAIRQLAELGFREATVAAEVEALESLDQGESGLLHTASRAPDSTLAGFDLEELLQVSERLYPLSLGLISEALGLSGDGGESKGATELYDGSDGAVHAVTCVPMRRS